MVGRNYKIEYLPLFEVCMVAAELWKLEEYYMIREIEINIYK